MSNDENKQIIPEVVVAAEKVQTQNIRTVVEFSQTTRKLVRELDERIIALKNLVMTQQGTIDNIQKQMAAIQQRLYSGGTEE